MLLECFKDSLSPNISFVTCSIDDARFARVCANIRGFIRLLPYEIIRIPDAKSLAEGYNRGVARARGDWIIFCHDDIAFLNPDVVARLLRHFACVDVLGLAGTSLLATGNWFDVGPPHVHGAVVAPRPGRPGHFELQVFGRHVPPLVPNAQAVDGIFIAARRSTVDALDGFNERDFQDFYQYDIDFSYRAHLAGFRVGIATDILVYHASHVANFPPEKLRRWEGERERFAAIYRAQLQVGAPRNPGLTITEVDSLSAAVRCYESSP